MTSSLRSRIRNGTLLLLALVIVLGAYALPRLNSLGGAIRETLYRNYISIEVGQHQHEALRTLERAERDGKGREALPTRDTFMHWMDIELHDITEVGEPEIANDIEARALRLFDGIANAPPGERHDNEFDQLHARIDDLIALNKAAMFRADSRASRLGTRLTYEIAAGFAILLLVGAALSIWMGWALSRPLTELAERLRGISQRKSHVRLGPQTLAELDEVARRVQPDGGAPRALRSHECRAHRLREEQDRSDHRKPRRRRGADRFGRNRRAHQRGRDADHGYRTRRSAGQPLR